MQSFNFIKRIKFYSILSFLVPLIAINSCFALYKFIGSFDTFDNFDWEKMSANIMLKEKVQYSYDEYLKIASFENQSFTNCSKFKYRSFYVAKDNQIIQDTNENSDIVKEIFKNNNVVSIIYERKQILNKIVVSIIYESKQILKDKRCIKNNQFAHLLLKNFSSLEKILVKGKVENSVGFAQIENPYFYGEVAISRTARYFPATLIFKPLIILSAIFLLLYWKNNLNFFKELENQNILIRPSKVFFYFGVFSCVFLILHASFLGIDSDSQLFRKIRKLIITLFIFFEVFAQIFLTKNLFKFKKKLEKYINTWILKLKITFVTVIFIISCAVFALLVWGDISSSFKHVLEWNYFSLLLIYYLLSRLLWKH